MWDNNTVVGFTQAEKNWLAGLEVSSLRDIGFNSGQRAYLKNTTDPTIPKKIPKGFGNYPVAFPKSSSQYQVALTSETLLGFHQSFSQGGSPFSTVSNNSNIQQNNVSQTQPAPQSPQQELSWLDAHVVNLPPQNKKWLAGRPVSDLKRWGFKMPQIDYLKSCTSYTGMPVRPEFATMAPPPPTFGSGQFEVSTISEDDDEAEETGSSVDPLVETAHDLEVKYLDCLGIKDNHIIRAVGFSTSNGKNIIQYKKIDANGNLSSTLEEKFDQSFNFTLPKLGMINYNDHVIYIERTHKKSSPGRYRKGLRSDSLKFYNLSFRELKSLSKVDVANPSQYNYEDSARKLAKAIFFPETLTFKEAIDEVIAFKRLSAAFTSSLAIKLDSNLNKIILQKHNWMIGEYNPENNLFEMYIDTFNDDLIKLNIPFKVAA